MANVSLGNATKVASMLKEDALLIEVGGSVRRIALEDFEASINSGQGELLQSVAWGVPMKYGVQSSPEWGMVGNLSAYASYKAKVGRYALTSKSAGIAQARKCHPNDSTVLLDGTAVATDGTQQVMVIAPRLYFLWEEGDSYPTLWMSEFPISGHYLATTADGRHIVAGAYNGNDGIDSSKLVSVHGVQFSTSGANIESYWKKAQAWNTGMGLIDYSVWRWICMMCLCEGGGNANAQAAIGYGPGGNSIDWTTFNASTVLKTTGKTSVLGDATGKVDIPTDDGGATNSCHVSVLGIEDFWNCTWQRIQGVYFGSSDNSATGQDGTEIFLYSGNRMPSADELKSTPSGSYRKLARLTSGGYVKSILGGEHFDLFPSAVGGSSASYFCDNSWASATGQLCLVGAAAHYGAGSGPFCVGSGSAWSDAGSNHGARPAFYGTVEFV